MQLAEKVAGVLYIRNTFDTQFKKAHNSMALGWIFSNQYLAWKACFDFYHSTPPFQPMIKFYVLVGFQATAVTIATVTQSTSFCITSIISKSNQTLSNKP